MAASHCGSSERWREGDRFGLSGEPTAPDADHDEAPAENVVVVGTGVDPVTSRFQERSGGFEDPIVAGAGL